MPATYDEHTRRILDAIEAGRPVSQRSLSRELGVAVGLINLLIRRLVKKGFLRVLNIRPNRVRYLITPAGIMEKARVTRAFLESTVRLYTQTREQIRATFVALSAMWPSNDGWGAGIVAGDKPIVFYGAGEVAEIGYISLQTTDLRLVGVVDDYVRTPFFGLPVHMPEDLRRRHLNGQPFACVVIMSFRKAEEMMAKLHRLGFPQAQIVRLDGLPARVASGQEGGTPEASREPSTSTRDYRNA